MKHTQTNKVVRKFVTDSGSWLVWRTDYEGYSVYLNINKHTGERIVRRLSYEH